MLCTFGTRSTEVERPAAITALDGGRGYNGSQHWIDYNLDGRLDYCRTVGNGPYEIWCQTLAASGRLGPVAVVGKAIADKGYDNGSRWVDMNGDGIPDWCRLVGSTPAIEQCLLSDKIRLSSMIQGR
jgi:hypothetical protein